MWVLVLGDVVLWLLTMWYGGAWTNRRESRLSNANASGAVFLVLGVGTFIVAAAGHFYDVIFLISGLAFLLMGTSMLLRPRTVTSVGYAPRGASALERFISFGALASVLTIITLVR